MSKLVFPLFFLLALNANSAFSQCNTRFSYLTIEEKGETDKSDKKDFSISLKLEEGPLENYIIELFDLYMGEVVEKKNFSFKAGELKKVFLNVKPSRYLIYLQNGSCKKQSIKSGIEGIEIK